MARIRRRTRSKPPILTAIHVAGFKSIREEQAISVRPLTILAGANSSGKSSIMQPMLLLKQTLDATFDPGPLRLNGPNLKFTRADQFMARTGKSASRMVTTLTVGFVLSEQFRFEIDFQRAESGGMRVKEWRQSDNGTPKRFSPQMNTDTVMAVLPESMRSTYENTLFRDMKEPVWQLAQDRCFFDVGVAFKRGQHDERAFITLLSPFAGLADVVQATIHVPGLRGNPARDYPVSAIGPTFEGTFESYVASVIAHWKRQGATLKLKQLQDDLEDVGLTWKVETQPVDETRVELVVGRLPHAVQGGARDTVSIADVGFGVSQVLPVIVSLIEAVEGQVVYIEQPEIHLHPRAQVKLASILARAAKRGVRVIIETHSSLLLLAIRALVAEGKVIDPGDVILHWFSRREKDGQTEVATAELDKAGAFGDWPVDFGDVALELESRYLDAAEPHLFDASNE